MKIVKKAERNAERETPRPNRKRGSGLLMLQVSLGGCAGVAIALIVLKVLGMGVFRRDDANSSVVQNQISTGDREHNVPTSQTPPNARPGSGEIRSPISANRPQPKTRAVTTPIAKAKNENSDPDSSPITSNSADRPAVKPEILPRMPITKDALGEHLARAKIPAAAQIWWSDRGAFEFDNIGALRFTDFLGKESLYFPKASAEGYLEIDSDLNQERIRLYLDHAEIAREPFETYEPLYAKGQWIVGSDNTGVDWFPKAIIDVNAALHKSRTSAKEYMLNLFSTADKLKAAGKLKDIPFGFDLNVERQRFTNRGLVPWSAPLLPMTEEYLEECRKLHKNLDAGYSRIAQRLTTQREKAAKDFLEYHQWKNAHPWPIAVLSWGDASSGKEARYTLFSSGAVNDPYAKVGWKLNKDILEVDIGERRVRLRIGATGKDFSLIGQEPPVTGTFHFDGERLAY